MLESLFTVMAICLDSLAIGIAYGMKNIRIPKKSLLMLNIVCTFFLSVSMILGNVIKSILPEYSTSFISFIILFVLGIFFLMESFIGYMIRKNKNKKKIEIKISNIKIIIDVIVDCTKADMNSSGDIDIKESIYLGTALSLDALGIGFGSAIGDIKFVETIIFSFVFNIFVILLGLYLGRKLISKYKLDFSWVSGLILIFLAISKLR